MTGQTMKSPRAMSRAELEDEVAWLRSELGISVQAGVIHALINWGGLTPQGAHICAALYAADRALTRAQLMDRLPIRDRVHESNLNHISVVVHGIRHRLGQRFDVDMIETVTGGYRLTPQGREGVAAVLEPILNRDRQAA